MGQMEQGAALPALDASLPALPPGDRGRGWTPGSGTFLPTCCWGCDHPHGCGMVLEGQQQGWREEEGRGWLDRGWQWQEVWGSWGAVSGCSCVCVCRGVCIDRCMAKRWCWLCDEKPHFQLQCPTGWEGTQVWGEARCTSGICKKGQRQACTSKGKPSAPAPKEALMLLSPLAWHHPSFLASPAGLGTPLTSSLLGSKTVRPPLPLCIFPSLLENGAVKRLSTIS